jgi:hypothetical protein
VSIHTNAAFVYPLVVAWWFAPLSALGGVAHLIYAIASLMAIVAACWLARPAEPLIAALVLLSSCAVIGLQDGTVNPWLLLGLVVAWRWRDRPVVAGVALALLIVGKLFLWPVLGWLLISRRYRAAGIAVLLTGVTLTAGWIFGPLSFGAYTSMLHVLSGIEVSHTSSLSGLLLHLHASLSLATALSSGVALLLLGGVAYRMRRDPARAGGDRLAFGTAVVAALLASPIVWHHYYLLLAVPLLIATRSVWPFVVLSFTSWAAAGPHTISSAQTVQGHLLGLGGIAAIALAAASYRWRQRPAAKSTAFARAQGNGALGPVALTAALAVLLVAAMSVLEDVSVGAVWGALVTLVEAVGVLAFLSSNSYGGLRAESGLAPAQPDAGRRHSWLPDHPPDVGASHSRDRCG